MSDARRANGWQALQVAVAGISAVIAMTAAGVNVSTVDVSRMERLESRVRRLTAEVNRLDERVLKLERPDQPVLFPRHPGRIGSAVTR